MIEINKLTKIYNYKSPNEITGLSNVSFSIAKGEKINIIGRTGSGKSTICNLLLGIIKPTSGNFLINGKEYDSKSRRKKLRLITNDLLSSLQYPDHQLFTKSVKEEILFNSKNIDEDKKYMYELLEYMDLNKNILNQSPFNLSSGQKRKIILISILIKKPEILIFDEATAFLDPQSRNEFIDLVKKINFELKTTMIFVSHNIKDVSRFSKRTILLKDGRMYMDSNTEDVVKYYLEGGY
ncbi:MAG: energy-coupling factor transporter ATP-binding protein EcfA2 [Candidatus Tyloplasma litorale]|nr:MAG: energy-coupling factor transporter ATP-binding protein EcfA2 [Mycoplasmatales bacterium]